MNRALPNARAAVDFETFLAKPIVQSHVYDRLVAMQNVRMVEVMDAVRAPVSCLRLSSAGSSKRILLVEDNAINVQVAARQLWYIGCEVISVDNGKAAVEILEREQLRRRFDGLQYAHHGRIYRDEAHPTERGRSKRRRRIPIVAMTANASRGRDRAAVYRCRNGRFCL